jgi:hypothetical protein
MIAVIRGAEFALYVGRKKTGVSIKPDAVWPKMWRVHQGERVSDMVNLARAKDAAISWALAGRDGGFGDKVPHWRPTETRSEADPIAFEQAAVPEAAQ